MTRFTNIIAKFVYLEHDYRNYFNVANYARDLIYINMFQNIDSNSDDNRGLASADKDTTERVASEGGKAPHKNDNKD